MKSLVFARGSTDDALTWWCGQVSVCVCVCVCVFVFETQRDRERAREGFVNLSQLALELKRCWELANITEFQKSPLGGHEHLTSAFKLCSEETQATHTHTLQTFLVMGQTG